MANVSVWSERGEAPGVVGWHDCTQSAALMALVYAGFTRFPLGMYTMEERNALDASDDRPDNTGSTFDGRLPTAGNLGAQLLNRYGVTLHRLMVPSTTGLLGALRQPRRAFVLAGSLGHYPAGHRLRRWQPGFTGGHAVCYISLTADKGLWLDPLATNRFAGDSVTPMEAAVFSWTDWEARYLDEDELATMPDTSTQEKDMRTTITIKPAAPGTRISFAAGSVTKLYDPDFLGGPVKTLGAPKDRSTSAPMDATVVIERSPLAAPVGTFRRIGDGPYAGLLVVRGAPGVTIIPPPPAEAPDKVWRDWLATAPK